MLGGLTGALLGTVLLGWNPFEAANLLAVAVIGFAIAPIFPAFMSGTAQRVGAHFAANTIGIQITATGLGMAVIPSLVGVLARRFSLEISPISMAMLFVVLAGLYLLAIKSGSKAYAHSCAFQVFGCLGRLNPSRRLERQPQLNTTMTGYQVRNLAYL